MLFQLYLLLYGITFLFYLYDSLQKPVLLTNRREFINSSVKQRKNKNLGFFILTVIFVILSLYCGLRTSYNDTYTYVKSFYEMNPSFSSVSMKLSQNPGFEIYQRVIKRIFNDPQMLLLITSAFVQFSFVRFIAKYSKNTYISGFLFLASGIYLFNFGALKQGIAIGILLFSIDFILNKKYTFFYILVALATVFHFFAIVFFAVPFFTGKPFNKSTKGILIFSVLAGIFFNNFLAFIIDFLGLFSDAYTDELLTEGSGISLFRLLYLQ